MTDKVAFEPPPNRTAAILVLFDHDGVTPTRRDFRSVAEGVKAFERLEAYHAALRRKNRAAPNADVMQLYARTGRPDVWTCERCSGGGEAAVRLGKWVPLRCEARFEAGRSRMLAFWAGCLVRCLLWLAVQRRAPSAGTGRDWPGWVVRLLNAALEGLWPTLRGVINDSVNVTVPPIANAAIARMRHRAVDKITRLQLDVGDEQPTITYVRLAPSLSGYEYLDLDLGVRLRGHRVKLDLEVNLGGDELPDVEGAVTRFGVEGALRVKLGPCATALPCFGLLRVGFTERPALQMESSFKLHDSVVALPVGISLSAIDRFVARLIENVLHDRLCWPTAVPVRLGEILGGPAMALGEVPPARPIGALRVEVLGCANLLNNDVGANAACVASLDARRGITYRRQERPLRRGDAGRRPGDDGDHRRHLRPRLVRGGVRDMGPPPSSGGRGMRPRAEAAKIKRPRSENPKTFSFDVHESSQACHLAVYDCEADNFNTFADALLGTATLSVSALADRAEAGPVELTLPLDTSGYDGKMKQRAPGVGRVSRRRGALHSSHLSTEAFSRYRRS